MNNEDMDNGTLDGRARTSTVLVFLAAAAVMVSWLGVYAVTNALISVDLLSGWPREADPRPQWLVQVFLLVFGTGSIVALLFRFFSNRSLRRIDAMADVEG
jgi:TRAP-type C4-dicarboxylate transport system permease small subunit